MQVRDKQTFESGGRSNSTTQNKIMHKIIIRMGDCKGSRCGNGAGCEAGVVDAPKRGCRVN